MADDPGNNRPGFHAGSYSYGAYVDGPDPLAPPADLRSLIDQIGDEVMQGSSPQQALRELLRQGMPGRGLDDLLRQVWKRRRELQKNSRLDGTLQEVRELLDQALTAERTSLRTDLSGPGDEFRAMELDMLSPNTAAAVRELDKYQWKSAEAAEKYQQIKDLLGAEMLDQRFDGMKQALESATPQQVAAVQEMLVDLNSLLAAHAAGQNTDRQFDEFIEKHGQYFPEQPSSLDELIDLLAARAAAAARMMRSLSAEQRAELSALSQQAFGDRTLADAMAQLDAQLQDLRPGEDWSGAGNFDGDGPLGMGAATRAMEQLGALDALAEQLGQGYPGATLADIDADALRDALGEAAGQDLQELTDLERQLRDQGIFDRAADGTLRLSPKALRQLGESALRDAVAQVGSRTGERDTNRSGATGEPTGASLPWEFGSTAAWDVPRTLLNSQLRQAGGHPQQLDVSDVAIIETARRTRAAVSLLVDTSWSMVQDGRWVPMKRTALALHQLISTRFRTDDLQLITFGRQAAKVELGELIGLEGAYVQGTNLHHALLLAGQHLRRHPDAMPVVMVVTDGEPTAHLEAAGRVQFSYPPQPETLRATVFELDRLTARKAAITFFILGDDPRLAQYMDELARRCGGRVVAPDLDGLGAEVVADYLKRRR